MSDNKQNFDQERIEAFLKSPAGFWTCVGVVGAIALGAIVSTFIG